MGIGSTGGDQADTRLRRRIVCGEASGREEDTDKEKRSDPIHDEMSATGGIKQIVRSGMHGSAQAEAPSPPRPAFRRVNRNAAPSPPGRPGTRSSTQILPP